MLVVIWDIRAIYTRKNKTRLIFPRINGPIVSVQRIASLGGDVKLLALFPSSFCHWSNPKGRKRTHTTVRKADGFEVLDLDLGFWETAYVPLP